MRAALAICKCVENNLIKEMALTGDPDDVQWFKSFSKDRLSKFIENPTIFIANQKKVNK